MNSYQLRITVAPKKIGAEMRYVIALMGFTGSPPRPPSGSGISPLFPFIKANCLPAPGPDTRSVAYRGGVALLIPIGGRYAS
jgi:hypothetical protein